MATAQISLINAAGDAAANTSSTWNNVARNINTGDVADLLDSTGALTGWSLDYVDETIGANSNANDAPGSSNAAWVDEGLVARSYHRAGTTTQGAGTWGHIRFGGLNNGETYDIELFASAPNGSAQTAFAIDDAAFSSPVVFDALGNTTQTVLFSGLTPTGGEINLYWRGADDANFGHLNALRITNNAAPTDTNPPTITGEALPTAVTDTTVTLELTSTDASAIEARYVAVARGAAAPSNAEVDAGEVQPLTSGVAANFTVTSLSAATAYDVYGDIVDGPGNRTRFGPVPVVTAQSQSAGAIDAAARLHLAFTGELNQ